MSALLEVTNLSVSHGSLRTVWDVSFRISQSERIGLLGANGAGKTTTLGALMGLHPPDGGDIRLDGNSLRRCSPAEIVSRGLALVPEGRRLFPEMSVRENIEMGAYLPGPRRHLQDTLESVYGLFPILKQKASQPAGELSGGQQQMVAIGRALMTRPRILLLDEPFLGLAPLLVQEVLKGLGQISARGMTIILVEQNIHRALDFVEAAYVIENGRTVLRGSRDELIENPDFSRKFLGLD
jgi:branched-chain amino acid transport system ATP-binding protein